MKLRFENSFETYSNKVTKCNLVMYINDLLGTPEQKLCEVTGISKLHPDDEWDEILGKRIAESRALIKARKVLNRFIKIGIAEEKTIIKVLESELKKHTLKLDNEIAHLNSLIKNE